MNEVSCRALQANFAEAKRRGVAPEKLAEGTGVPLAHLRDPKKYIDWSAFVQFNKNLGKIFDRDQLIDLGGAFLRSPLLKPFTLVARLLFTVADFFRWAYSPKSPFTGMFTCVKTEYLERGPGAMQVRLSIAEGYEPCEEFFLISQGGMAEAPTVLGLPRAKISARFEGRVASYEVEYSVRGGALSRVWRALTRPFAMASAAKELKEAHETLRNRYFELQEARDKLELRVQERTAELARANEQLKENDRQKTQFFANASHELRTPITLILSPLEALAASGEVPESAKRELEGALKGTHRLLKLVNDLLDLQKIEAGRMKLRVNAMDLSRTLEEAVRPFARVLAPRQVELKLEIEPGLKLVADPERLEQVALNLVSNAVKFTPDYGTIRVRASKTEGGAQFSVENTGETIDAAELPGLFERFAQSPTSRQRRFGSTGLGLPVVRELVELHGGRVTATSEKGLTAFTVQVPSAGAVEADAVAITARASTTELAQYEAVARPESAAVKSTVVRSGKKLVLVAEDNAELRGYITRSLSDEYDVVEAGDGKAALETARAQRPDAVVSDLMMPQMNGFELCTHLKADPETAAIPFVLLSARSELDVKVTGLSAGADDYLTKPFQPAELKARLSAQLRLRELAAKVAEHQKLAALGTLVAGVAHEVRNPLNGLLNSLLPVKEMIQNSPPEVTELIDIAIAGARRVDEISSQLLAQARAGEGNRGEVDLRANLELAVKLLSYKLEQGPKLGLQIADADLRVLAESGALNQIWVNLIDNAIGAAGRAGHVDVRAGRVNGHVVVEVQDDGPGIEPKILGRIFDPFFTTKPVGSGTGLGLSIVKQIVERHGGTIAVDSRPGAGARFVVALPSAEPKGAHA